MRAEGMGQQIREPFEVLGQMIVSFESSDAGQVVGSYVCIKDRRV